MEILAKDTVSDRRIAKQVIKKKVEMVSRLSRSSEKRICLKRIRKLRKMIPKSESMELNGLFRETADYIVWLQMKVRMMQALVHVLNGSDEWLYWINPFYMCKYYIIDVFSFLLSFLFCLIKFLFFVLFISQLWIVKEKSFHLECLS